MRTGNTTRLHGAGLALAASLAASLVPQQSLANQANQATASEAPTPSLGPGASAAALPSPPVSLPYGECSLSAWSSNRNLDDRQNIASASCTVNWKPQISADLRLGLNLHAGSQFNLATDTANGRIREAYVDFERDALALRFGRQIVAWGRADGVNPTDKLAPKDFTLLSHDDESQRLGIDALKIRYALNPSIYLTAVAAQFTPHTTPQGALPANLVKAPEPTGTEWAVKLDRAGQGLDWSVSYFDGYERFARYRLDAGLPPAPVFRADYERSRSVGADLALASGAWTWRAEVSHTALRTDCTQCTRDERRVTRAVLGADLDFAQTMNLNMQFIATRHWNYQDPTPAPGPLRALELGRNRLNAEYAAVESGLTFRLSDRLLNDKLKWEIGAVFDLTGQSRLLRPRVHYALNDHVRLSAGIDFYEGDAQTYFGALTKNSLAFLMVSLVF
jgi:hypothetical protein